MKRTVLFFVMALGAIALVSAQGRIGRGPGAFPGAPQTAPEKTSVSGALGIARGMLAVNSGGVTYLAEGLHRYIGFIDGFKEGAAVSLEGIAVSFPEDDTVKFLRVSKMTFNGKDYDLARPGPDRQMKPQGKQPGMPGSVPPCMDGRNNRQMPRGRWQ